MNKLQVLFATDITKSSNSRFDDFISWAEPFGTAHIDHIHQAGYKRSDPWFEYAPEFLPHGHISSRSWFIKAEHLGESGIFGRVKRPDGPEIHLPHRVIEDGQFLHFAKAYVNVMMHLRRLRSAPKSMILALCFLEREIRILNGGRNAPSFVSHLAFIRTCKAVEKSFYGLSRQYDIGKDLEALSGMLQAGFHSKTFRYETEGFKLLNGPFVFSSPIPQAPRMRAIQAEEDQEEEDTKSTPSGRLSNESVVALGISYRRSAVELGRDHTATFLAALPGLALTTVSMRMSELLELHRDALYREVDGRKRLRIRISRPKIGIHQDLPVAERLSELATELFSQALQFSADASDAFKFYVSKFDRSLDDIDELYIPTKYQDALKQEYLTCEQAWKALGLAADGREDFPFRFGHLEMLRAVRVADGSLVATDSLAELVFSREQIAGACRDAGITFVSPSNAIPEFLSLTEAYRLMKCRRRTAQSALLPLRKSAVRTERVIRSDALQAAMLADFKCQAFPHWPYVSNSGSTRLDEALLVWHEQNSDSRNEPGTQERLWWKPRTVSAGSINRWISNEGNNPPILFALLDVRLRDGNFPSITIHKTRKRHHTQALLAGVSEPFLDELAGRTSGRQSDHYDRRTAREIVTESIEGFDPDENYEVVGPVAKLAPDAVKVVERRAFLFENAAPKHVTEVGGCRTDWSLNPCEQFGDCMRCGKSVWRKGDQKRLPRVIDIRSESLRMLSIGRRKLQSNPRLKSIARQIRQCKETIARCDRIIAIENDPSIAVGTIVTFDAAPTAFGASDLASLLRSELEDFGASRLPPAN